MQDRYIRAQEITRTTALSLSTILRLEQEGDFPPRRALGPNSVGWLESEVNQWMQTRQPTISRNCEATDKTRGPSS
jgi:prophage regulatory protein